MTVEGMKGSLQLYDDFSDDLNEGGVIGTLSTNGQRRLGVDVEGVISIDNGALRIAPLIEAGFGRAAIAYGPFRRQNGLAFAVSILNGHNTAQAESLPETFRERMETWLRGSETDPKWQRVAKWFKSGRVRRTLRQFRRWKRTAKDSQPVTLLDENLAVGWFPADVVRDPRLEGSPFIMHALGPENGELWAGGNGCRTRPLRGVQNLPLYLTSIVRPEGLIYYISSIDGAPGMADYPHFRPVAVENGPLPEDLYLGIQQSVLGQIGWRLDTRVKGVRVAHVPGYDTWYGGAKAADRLTGEGALDGSEAETGGKWCVLGGQVQRGPAGATGSSSGTVAILDPGSPSGLIHAVASPGQGDRNKAGLVWRFIDEQNHWRVELGDRSCEILLVDNGGWRIMATRLLPGSFGRRKHRLQVLDDGYRLMAYLDGEPLSEGWLESTRFEGATKVGFFFNGSDRKDGAVSSFEAHPRQISVDPVLDLGTPWFRKGSRVIVEDDFSGEAGDLDGRKTPVGEKRWSRLIGKGVIELTGEGAARIRGSVESPCPGRTAYCVDWLNPDFADLEVTITPPGTERGQNQRSIAGFILYQDPDNYVTLNVWRADYYGGASISTFFKVDGFEDLYDAIWTNVGDRVYYGRPSRLRMSCDGERYLVFVNDEPVLYRAFRDVYASFGRLQIRKVGLMANWEFGKDTGSKFEQFRSRI